MQRALRIFGIDEKKWAKRHGIEPYTGPCDECGETLSTTIPFVYGGCRGLMSPPCPSCGKKQTPYCMVWPEGAFRRSR